MANATTVEPTDLAPSNHSFFNSLAESTRNDFFTPASKATSTSRTEFDVHGAPVYVRKQIVHNKHVVETLEKRGAMFLTAA